MAQLVDKALKGAPEAPDLLEESPQVCILLDLTLVMVGHGRAQPYRKRRIVRYSDAVASYRRRG